MISEVYNQSQFLTVKAAYLYYMKNMPQSKIAKKLNISVPTVSRLLNKAREDKIIEFVINDPYLECIELEQDLMNRFGLKEVIIAADPVENKIEEKEDAPDNHKKLVALEGARYLQRIIKDEDILGIAFGRTMYYMIHYLNPCQKVNAQFVTLHGSLNSLSDELDVASLARRMAMAFGGENKVLYAEGFSSNENLTKQLKEEKNVKKIIDRFKKVTISITGIGSFYPDLKSLLVSYDFLEEEELDHLTEKGVVGDMALRFFDSEGNECDTDFKNRTIAIDFESYKKIPLKIVMVSGVHKTQTVISALKGNLIDVLITNYSLGKSILNNGELEPHV
jgi:DNA-binding transcriptional regulator LsrR (DeoR family)